MKEIIIIGGGASGIMAALFAAGAGSRVTVLEQNDRPLRKLRMTGNGRCNFTNLSWEGDVLRGSAPQKARVIVQRFDCRDAIRFFASIGIEAKDRDGWVYPLNDSAAMMAKQFLYEAERRHVTIRNNACVRRIAKGPDGRFSVKTDDWQYAADAVIVAAGSRAGIKEGGCRIAEEAARFAGLRFSAFSPALVPLYCAGKETGKWAGVRTDGSIRLFADGTFLAQAEGVLQLTERGISGIPVFQVSRYAVCALKEGKRVLAQLDFLPTWTKKDIEKYLERCRMRQGKTLRFSVAGLLPEKLAAVLTKNVEAAQEAAGKIKSFSLPVTGYGDFAGAQASCGGVALEDLTEELEAKTCPGLYFTGENVDVDGTCGGYNLQWAWSSAHAAGLAAAAR